MRDDSHNPKVLMANEPFSTVQTRVRLAPSRNGPTLSRITAPSTVRIIGTEGGTGNRYESNESKL